MRVLLLTDGIAPVVMGGMQKHSRLIAEYLSREGHEITLFHYSEKPVTENVVRTHFSPEANENLEFHHFIYKDNSRLPGHYLRAQREMSKRYLAQYLNLEKSFDFIYTKGFIGWALLQQRHKLRIETPIAVKLHGMNMFQPQASLKAEFQKYLLRPAVKTIMERADFVFSYGGKITEIIKSQCSTPVLEVPTGINDSWVLSSLPKRSGLIKFLFVGRFDRVKGLPELYQALEALSEIRNDWECHFVGPIPERHRLPNARCVFHGAVYESEILKQHYDHCDIFLNTSISEGMPNVILEGMARGLAIIATNVGATSVLVSNSINGTLISSPNVKFIQNAMAQLLSLGRSGVEKMQKESLVLVRKMTWEQIGPQLSETIRNCIKV